MGRAWRLWAVGITLLAAGLVAAEPYIFSARSDLVYLPVRVQKKSGETIHGIRAEQFVVEDNGSPQKFRLEAAPESSGFAIVVLVQCSRSAPYEFVNYQGLGTMIEGIIGEARHEVAVVSYGDKPYVLGDFSGSAAAMRGALGKLKPCGQNNAATVDAVRYALGMLRSRQDDYRRAVLLIGETRDHGSRAKLHEVVAGLGVTDTVVYSVAFSPEAEEISRSVRGGRKDKAAVKPDENDAAISDTAPGVELPPEILPLVNALRKNTAAQLASLSGGDYFLFKSRTAFDEDLQKISNQIRNYYLLSFQPKAGAEAGLHTIQVKLKGVPDAVVQTRRSYWLAAR